MIYTYTPTSLIEGSALTNALVTYATANTQYGTIVKEIELLNTDIVARAVTIHIVPSGGSASVANRILGGASGESLQPGEQRVYSLSRVMKLGSFIQAKADAGAVVSINASGLEIS